MMKASVCTKSNDSNTDLVHHIELQIFIVLFCLTRITLSNHLDQPLLHPAPQVSLNRASSACHSIGYRGGTVGPDLTHIAASVTIDHYSNRFYTPVRLSYQAMSRRTSRPSIDCLTAA
jgi:hypothetical protein